MKENNINNVKINVQNVNNGENGEINNNEENEDIQPINILDDKFLNPNVVEKETQLLLKIKKEKLENQLKRITKQLETIDNIYEVEALSKKTDNDLTKKSIDQNKNICCCKLYSNYLFFNFNIIGPLFVIINLIGVFQLIIILKATGKELLFGIKSFLFEKEREDNKNFQNYFETICLKNIPDFNLIFITSIIGNIFLKGCGFRISSFIFLLINSTLIFIFSFLFDFPEKKYNFYELLLCIIYYVTLLGSIGSISLFAHQIYFDGLLKYNKFIIKNENNIENKKEGKETFFSYLCFTVIPAYMFNITINYFLKDTNYLGYFFYISISLYAITTIISIIIYSFYSITFVKENKKLENGLEINVSRICGYLIYSETTINEENKICCSGCRFGCRKGYYSLTESPLTCCIPCLTCICCECVEICGCCPSLQCCKCCEPIDLIESNQRKEFFCYCYKVQRKCSWFCDILFKKNTIVFIVFDITIELMNIGFEKIFNEQSTNYDDKKSMICLSIYIVSFLIISLMNRSLCHCNCLDKVISETISIILIAFFSVILSIIFSGFSSFGNEGLIQFTNDYLILVSLASLRYFYFIVMKNLVNILDENNIDILSNSTVISIFLTIYKMIASIFTDILDVKKEKLVLFQFIFGIICQFPIFFSACCLIMKTFKSKALEIIQNGNQEQNMALLVIQKENQK